MCGLISFLFIPSKLKRSGNYLVELRRLYWKSWFCDSLVHSQNVKFLPKLNIIYILVQYQTVDPIIWFRTVKLWNVSSVFISISLNFVKDEQHFWHLMWLYDTAGNFPPKFIGFSSLSPLIHHLITSPWPINTSHSGPSGSNFCTSQNVISWGDIVCVCSAAGNVQESFICFLVFLCVHHVFEAIIFSLSAVCVSSGSIHLH